MRKLMFSACAMPRTCGMRFSLNPPGAFEMEHVKRSQVLNADYQMRNCLTSVPSRSPTDARSRAVLAPLAVSSATLSTAVAI